MVTRKSPSAKSVGVRETRRPQRPLKLKRMYEDEDDVEVPDTALGGAKE